MYELGCQVRLSITKGGKRAKVILRFQIPIPVYMSMLDRLFEVGYILPLKAAQTKQSPPSQICCAGWLANFSQANNC